MARMLKPVERPNLTTAQNRVVKEALKHHANGEPFCSKTLFSTSSLSTHNVIRSLWKKGWVTPNHIGKISEWTYWRFTDRFFQDFPSLRPETKPEIKDNRPDLSESAQRFLDRRRK